MTGTSEQNNRPEAFPANSSSTSSELVGRLVDGRFEVLAELGRGGIATVYKARHVLLGQTVALKIMHEHLAHDPTWKQRFQQEARSVSQLSHPNIVSLLASGFLEDTRPYIVMEYLKGRSLAEISQSKKGRELGWLKAVLIEVCDALDYAHKKGLVHRDLKPSNIIISQSSMGDVAKLVDFGMAKIIESSPQRSSTPIEALAGSPPYMSPEQCAGSSIDCRSDIYSLGVIMYEMVVGVVPFAGATALGTMHKHLHDTARAPQVVNPAVPPELSTLIMDCLEKDAGKRPQNAAQVKERLQDLSMENVTEHGATREGSSHKILSILVLLAIALIASIALYSFTRSEPFRSRARVLWLSAKHQLYPASAREMLELARLYKEHGEHEKALLEFDNLASQLSASESEGNTLLLARILAEKADICQLAGQQAQAYEHAKEAQHQYRKVSKKYMKDDPRRRVEVSKELLALEEKYFGADSKEVVYTACSIGQILSEMGDYAGAVPYLERVVDIERVHSWLASLDQQRMHAHLARCLRQLGKTERAHEEDRIVVALNLGGPNEAAAESLLRLAEAAADAGRTKELRGLLHRYRSSLKNPVLLTPYEQLQISRLSVALHILEGREAQARKTAAAFKAQLENPGERAFLARFYLQLGSGWDFAKRYRDAQGIYKIALLYADGGNVTTRQQILYQLGLSLNLQGKLREAIAIEEEAIKIGLTRDAPTTLAGAHHTAGDAYFALNQLAKSEAEYRKALAVLAQCTQPDAPIRAGSMYKLAYTLMHRGKYAESEDKLRSALSIYERAETGQASHISCMVVYAQLLQRTGRHREAEIQSRKAAEWRKKL